MCLAHSEHASVYFLSGFRDWLLIKGRGGDLQNGGRVCK